MLNPEALVINGAGLYLDEWNLTDLDQIREDILKAGSEQFIISSSREDIFGSLIRRIGGQANTPLRTTRPQVGLAIKTHQSDLFNNWINTEWIEGENGNRIDTLITGFGLNDEEYADEMDEFWWNLIDEKYGKHVIEW